MAFHKISKLNCEINKNKFLWLNLSLKVFKSDAKLQKRPQRLVSSVAVTL